MPLARSRRLLTMCVLGAAVLGGCQASNSTKLTPVATVASTGWPTWFGHIAAVPTAIVANKGNAQPSGDMVPVVAVMPGTPDLVPVVASLPRFEAQAAPVLNGPVDIFVLPASAELPPEPPPVDDRPKFPRGAPETPRKAYADITAYPRFGHAPDYSWICGEAQKWRNDWRLRFASVDEVDPLGGRVNLAGEEFIGQLRDGEHFKLQGRLDMQDDKIGAAVFIIESVQSLGN